MQSKKLGNVVYLSDAANPERLSYPAEGKEICTFGDRHGSSIDLTTTREYR
jgi:hypothetical protein